MIEDRLMVPGGWDLKLRPNTPRVILDRLSLKSTATPRAGFGHIVITPTRYGSSGLDGTATATAPELLALSRYTGIYRAQSDDGLTISGPGPNAWIADEDGKGQVFGSLSYAAQTFQTMVAAFKPQALISGSIEAAGGSYSNAFTNAYLGDILHDILNFFAGREYRVNPNLTFDAGSQAFLYPTATTPTVVVRRRNAGRDLVKVGLEAAAVGVDRDLDDYTTSILLVSNGGAATTTNVAPYKDINGNTILMSRVVQSSVVATGNETAAAQAQLNRFAGIHEEATLELTDSYDVTADVRAGDTIYLYDPDLELVDTTTEIYFRGEVIYPLKLRVAGIRWPVEAGMGVYLIHSDATGAGGASASVTDLTDWVAFETGNTTLEVGSVVRGSSSGSVGTLESSGVSSPASIVAVTIDANDRNTIVGAYNVPGLSITFTAQPGHYYRAHCRGQLEANAAGVTGYIFAVPNAGGDRLAQDNGWGDPDQDLIVNGTLPPIQVVAPGGAAASTTWYLQVQSTSANSLNVIGGHGLPTKFWIEDVGMP